MLTITEGINKNISESIYIGEVVDVDDPLRLQRVRVRLDCYPKNMKVEQIPWASPLRSAFQGGGNGLFGQISVPEKGSIVAVKHYYDQYSPVYIGVIQSSLQKNLVIDNQTDYPRVYGSEDSNGNFIRVELIKKLVRALMDAEIQVTQKGDIKIDMGENNIHLKCGNILLETSSSIQITSGKINTNSHITAQKIDVATINTDNLSALSAQANGTFQGTLQGTAYYATYAGVVPANQPIPSISSVGVPTPITPKVDFNKD